MILGVFDMKWRGGYLIFGFYEIAELMKFHPFLDEENVIMKNRTFCIKG